MLEGTSTSATLTTALAPISSDADGEAGQRVAARDGRRTDGPRRHARNASIAAPAITKRPPAERNGGTVSTTTRMAR